MHSKSVRTAYKLMRVRRDGSPGSLFINRRRRLPTGVWLEAESHPTKGYALRPGWHCTPRPLAPHLTMRGRRWYRVLAEGCESFSRPVSQGGEWLLAKRMMILEPLEGGAECREP